MYNFKENSNDFAIEYLLFELISGTNIHNTRDLACTYIIFATLHVVCKGGAAELVGTEEAEVAGDLSGYGGGQALEETQRTLVLHDVFHHRPH